MVCNGCNECKCKEVDVLSGNTEKQLNEKLKIFNDLVCVIANTNCLDFPRVMAKAFYMLWCYLKDLTNILNALSSGNATYDDSDLRNRIEELERLLASKVDNDTIYDDTQLRNRVNDLENERAILGKIIANLEKSGAWQGGLNGNFVEGRNIATGNINLFGGTADGDSFIRTNNGETENDLAGGV